MSESNPRSAAADDMVNSAASMAKEAKRAIDLMKAARESLGDVPSLDELSPEKPEPSTNEDTLQAHVSPVSVSDKVSAIHQFDSPESKGVEIPVLSEKDLSDLVDVVTPVAATDTDEVEPAMVETAGGEVSVSVDTDDVEVASAGHGGEEDPSTVVVESPVEPAEPDSVVAPEDTVEAIASIDVSEAVSDMEDLAVVVDKAGTIVEEEVRDETMEIPEPAPTDTAEMGTVGHGEKSPTQRSGSCSPDDKPDPDDVVDTSPDKAPTTEETLSPSPLPIEVDDKPDADEAIEMHSAGDGSPLNVRSGGVDVENNAAHPSEMPVTAEDSQIPSELATMDEPEAPADDGQLPQLVTVEQLDTLSLMEAPTDELVSPTSKVVPPAESDILGAAGVNPENPSVNQTDNVVLAEDVDSGSEKPAMQFYSLSEVPTDERDSPVKELGSLLVPAETMKTDNAVDGATLMTSVEEVLTIASNDPIPATTEEAVEVMTSVVPSVEMEKEDELVNDPPVHVPANTESKEFLDVQTIRNSLSEEAGPTELLDVESIRNSLSPESKSIEGTPAPGGATELANSFKEEVEGMPLEGGMSGNLIAPVSTEDVDKVAEAPDDELHQDDGKEEEIGTPPPTPSPEKQPREFAAEAAVAPEEALCGCVLL